MTKRKVILAARERMRQYDDRFGLYAAVDYVDDGLELVKIGMVPKYMEIIKEDYAKRGLYLNTKKTKIIIYRPDEAKREFIRQNLNDILSISMETLNFFRYRMEINDTLTRL